MRNFMVAVAYDGTNYHGFQKQRGTALATVQDVLEKKLSLLASQQVKVTGAGRTDAGVHARGQVINFKTRGWNIPAERIACALNSVLPPDIVAVASQEVSCDFHARFSARAKIYSYTIFNERTPSPFCRFFSYHVPQSLDLRAMQAAAELLTGEHDFRAFQAAGSLVKNTVRNLYLCKVVVGGRFCLPDCPPESKENFMPGNFLPGGKFVRIYFKADGFLYKMARNLTGTLLEVGRGKIGPDNVLSILSSGDRSRAGPTAPAHGLCLEKVEYE